MPACRSAPVRGAEQREAHLRPVAVGRPRLLPAEEPRAVGLALAAGLDAGEVAAGAGLAEQLAPDVVDAADARAGSAASAPSVPKSQQHVAGQLHLVDRPRRAGPDQLLGDHQLVHRREVRGLPPHSSGHQPPSRPVLVQGAVPGPQRAPPARALVGARWPSRAGGGSFSRSRSGRAAEPRRSPARAAAASASSAARGRHRRAAGQRRAFDHRPAHGVVHGPLPGDAEPAGELDAVVERGGCPVGQEGVRRPARGRPACGRPVGQRDGGRGHQRTPPPPRGRRGRRGGAAAPGTRPAAARRPPGRPGAG